MIGVSLILKPETRKKTNEIILLLDKLLLSGQELTTEEKDKIIKKSNKLFVEICKLEDINHRSLTTFLYINKRDY